jgi:hypothetical protein
MTNVLDWILDLFRDPVQAQAFLDDPDRSMQNAGVQNVSAAQVNAVAATVAPAAVLHGNGNPVHGLQQAVAETHGIAFVPQTQTQAFSNNDTLSHNDVLSNNDPHFLSPEAGHDVQQGGVNLDFGDITFGDKTTNTATDGGVVVDGDNDGDILTDGSVKQTGDDNNANTGDIETGDHSPVVLGNDNDLEDNSQETGGGDIIQDNDGPVVKTGDIDTSGGNASGGDGGHGGGILTGGGGDGGAANAGGGGGVVIAPVQTTTTNTGGGDITNVETGGGDISGGVDASHDDNSSNSHNTDNSTHDSHDDFSTHDSHDSTVETNVDVHTEVDAGLF